MNELKSNKLIQVGKTELSGVSVSFLFTFRDFFIRTKDWQIKSANFDADVKHFEAILSSKQPDLLSYCSELTSTRDCIHAVRSIRDCKHHIQLAETIIANRYAALLAERSTDSDTSGKMTSSAVVTLGSIPLAAPPSYGNNATAAAASSSVSREILFIRRPFRIWRYDWPDLTKIYNSCVFWLYEQRRKPENKLVKRLSATHA